MYFIMPGDLKGREIAVYYYCCTQTNFQNEEFKGKKKFEFNISLRTIEEDISIERKSVSRVLKKLGDLGYIELIEKGKPPKKPSKYLLKFTQNIVNNNATMNTIINTNMDSTIQDIENTEFIDNQCTIDSTMSATMNPSPSNIYSNIISNNIYSSSEEDGSSEGSIKANTTQEPIKKEIDRKYLEIFEYWNSLKIIKHKECNEEIIKAIDKALKKYDIETIKLAINNYNTLFKDKRHFYSHRWALKNFLSQGNGISEFLEDGQQYINYQDNLAKYEKEKNKPSSEEERKIEETDFS